jgi:hypothetical protein
MKAKTTNRKGLSDALEDRIDRELARFKHKDLQRECILRGLEFKLIVEFDHHQLASWFRQNFENSQSLERLTLYDVWVENQLVERGYKKGDAILAPSLRFAFIPDMEKIGKIQTPGVQKGISPASDQVVKENKPKRIVDTSTGVYTGTKKNLTYQLTDEGKKLDDIIKTVMEKFPEAQEKSIKIWHKRRLAEKK